MHPPESVQYIDPPLAERELSESDILLRRAFVQEYMKTRSAYEACLAVGFLAAYAGDWAKAFMSEGIVRRLISEAEQVADSPEEKTRRETQYRSWMEKQATYYGPGSSHGARVSAITQLMKVEGMGIETAPDLTLGFKGGVMIVPQLQSPDDWSAKAAGSQADLKKTVRD